MTVPVGATLTINGRPTAQMTAVRQFVTPALSAGPKYRYVFEATYTWNGEEVIKRRQVDVAVGATYTVDMTLGETVKRRPLVEEEDPPPVVKKPEPSRPTPPKQEEPKPAPRPETPPVPRTETPTTPKPDPRPEPRKPDPLKPTDPPKPVVPATEPPRPVAPKPREIPSKQ